MGVEQPNNFNAARPKTLISAAEIQRRVVELGESIAKDYEDKCPVVVGVLTGAAVFASDLVRCIKIPLELDFIAASSYGKETHSSGEVRILKDLGHSIRSKHVLVVEDIVDSGLTLRCILEMLERRQPASLAACALLHKPSSCNIAHQLKYCGFEIEDRFVVGYGLDYKGLYRNLSYIGILQ